MGSSFLVFSKTLTPLSASLGNAGRSGYQAAEFHILNPATLSYGDPYRLSSFYNYSSDELVYGASITNAKNIPMGMTWIKEGDHHINIFSVAGKVSQQMFIGASVYRTSRHKDITPQIGILYIPVKQFILSATGTRMSSKEISYGIGSLFSYSKSFLFYLDTVYENQNFSFHGGMELITQNSFSLRVGTMWPDPSFNLGVSFDVQSIKLDYTWAHKTHLIGLRIQAP